MNREFCGVVAGAFPAAGEQMPAGAGPDGLEGPVGGVPEPADSTPSSSEVRC